MKSISPEQVRKYFLGQCTPKEAEKVLAWFRTSEGTRYLKHHFDSNVLQRLKNQAKEPRKPGDSEKMFTGIQNRIQQQFEIRKAGQSREVFWASRNRHRESLFIKLVAAVLILGFTAGYWWLQQGAIDSQTGKVSYIEYSTSQEQQKILTLVDGTNIRLQENSSISIPANYNVENRNVTLTGEAFFDVANNPELPFEITADKGRVRVLGTQFNVKIDSERRHVQVAVMEGTVVLNGNKQKGNSAALLTEGYFGVYNFDTRETIIEEAPVHNYVSWIDGVLAFEDIPLWKISRQFRWMYGVSFRFDDESIRNLRLFASIPADELDEVLGIVASTLEIEYHRNGNEVVWIK